MTDTPRPDEAERAAADELSALGQEMRLDDEPRPYNACWGPDVDGGVER